MYSLNSHATGPGDLEVGLYKIFFHFEAFVHEPIILSPPAALPTQPPWTVICAIFF